MFIGRNIGAIEPAVEIVIHIGFFFLGGHITQSQGAILVLHQRELVLTRGNIQLITLGIGGTEGGCGNTLAQPAIGHIADTVGVLHEDIVVSSSEGNVQLTVHELMHIGSHICAVEPAVEVVVQVGLLRHDRNIGFFSLGSIIKRTILISVIPVDIERHSILKCNILDIRRLISVTGPIVLETIKNQAGNVSGDFCRVDIFAVHSFHLGHCITGPAGICANGTAPIVGADISPQPVIAEIDCDGRLLLNADSSDADITGNQFARNRENTGLTVVATAGDRLAAHGDGDSLRQDIALGCSQLGSICRALKDRFLTVGSHIGSIEDNFISRRVLKSAHLITVIPVDVPSSTIGDAALDIGRLISVSGSIILKATKNKSGNVSGDLD